MDEPRLGDRSLFPRLEARAYLNHAGVSPPSEPVRAAALSLVDAYARSGSGAFAAAQQARIRLREKLGRLVGAAPADLGFTEGTGAGLRAVALCFPWRAGDRVLVFDGEFPSNVTPWQRAAAQYGLEVALLPLAPFERTEAEGLALLERELALGARLAAVSLVQFRSGLRMPVEAMADLCHRYGAQICVDAVQACGVVPVDVAALGADYLACGSHKWLMGLHGAGFLYARPGLAAALRPVVAGWLSHEQPVRFLVDGAGHLRYDRPIRTRIDFVEASGMAEVPVAALEAAIDLIASLGLPAVHAHVNRYLDRLEPALEERGFRTLRAREPERRSGMLCVLPPPGTDGVALRRGLEAQGVACAIPDGVLRFAPHWPNHPDEIPCVLAALDALMR